MALGGGVVSGRRRGRSHAAAQAAAAEAELAFQFFNGDEPLDPLPTVCTHDTPVGHRCTWCGNVKTEVGK